jgi:hypothetical protein
LLTHDGHPIKRKACLKEQGRLLNVRQSLAEEERMFTYYIGSLSSLSALSTKIFLFSSGVIGMSSIALMV